MRSISPAFSRFARGICLLAATLGAGHARAETPAGPPAEPPVEPRIAVESAWVVAREGGGERLVAELPPEGAVEQLVTLRFRHEGTEPAAGLRIVHPVPAGTRFVPGSATGPGTTLSYSIDGGQTFAAPGELPDPAAITHIRWDLAGKHPPGLAGLVSFRARAAEPDAIQAREGT
ncbi:MAG: hypothetical protein ACNA8G_08075 [Gammaproteobacteria bacterium]